MIDVDGFSLALRCAGSGEPAFIFEGGHADAEQSADYSIVQAEMVSQGVTRVCWYDRAGLGESEERPEPVISAEALAEELRVLLTEAGIEPPYVLAGGSFGGLLVRTYQATFPNDVAGLMFIDAIEERMARVELGPNQVREGHTVIPMRELTSVLHAADPLGDVPVMVIVASENAADPDWIAGQRRLAALSSNTVMFVARGTTHGVTHEVPELVTEAARQLIEAARSNAALPPCGGELEAIGARCLGE
jgi:pimeloyl-ACP methyl ester carboxylesterase